LAESIPIVNFGFESPPTATAVNGITGWTSSNSVFNSGVWNINADPAGFWNVPAPEGNQIAFVSEAVNLPETISQTLAATLEPGVYHLTGEVGHPIGDPAVYTVALYAGTHLLASTNGTGPQGSFAPFDAAFNSAGSPYIGQALRIELSSDTIQTGFDDIHLDFVPEPATAGLVALGSLALFSCRRRT
jgi:hypothetical protein